MLDTQSFLDRDAVLSALRWWRDAGVDVIVDEMPRDWLARPSNPLPTGESDGREATRERGRVPDSPSPGVAALRHPLPNGERADPLPSDLPAFLAWLATSADAPEAGWGRTRIMPAGDAASGLMILVDMPEVGDADALMSGELGTLFDRMLKAIGRDRASIWLAPLASVRPGGGRIDAPVSARLGEIARHHVSLVSPRRLLLMGDAPNRALLGMEAGKLRGRIHKVGEVETIATFHPRLLLQRAAYKAEAWKDLQLLMEGL